MTIADTSAQLTHLLANEDAKVIVITGRWGTGKSYMWEQVAKDFSSNEKIPFAASLFGARSVDEIKHRLLQSAAIASKADPRVMQYIKDVSKSAIKFFESFHKGFGVLKDVALLAAPALLQRRTLVLDDIERKHANLSVDEILGFVDEMTKKYKCRVVLIMNDWKLDQKDIWTELREKVVDAELRLNTTSSEALEIAMKVVPTKWNIEIGMAIEACGINNIRIIQKIIHVVNRILETQEKPEQSVLTRTVPSIVFLTAVYYKGIENAPDIGSILNRNTTSNSLATYPGEKEVAPKNETPIWKTIANRVGIFSTDNFELAVVEFLQTGMYDSSDIQKEVERITKQNFESSVSSELHKLHHDYYWDHKKPIGDLLSQAIAITKNVKQLNAGQVTDLYDILVSLEGGKVIADNMLDQWLAIQRPNFDGHNEFLRLVRNVHPRIKDHFLEQEATSQTNTSIVEVCRYFQEHGVLGERQKLVLRNATTAAFEHVIRTCEIPDLINLVAQMSDVMRYTNHEQICGSAVNNFSLACRRIIESEAPNSRLSRILKDLFDGVNMRHLLESEPEAS